MAIATVVSSAITLAASAAKRKHDERTGKNKRTLESIELDDLMREKLDKATHDVSTLMETHRRYRIEMYQKFDELAAEARRKDLLIQEIQQQCEQEMKTKEAQILQLTNELEAIKEEYGGKGGE